MIIRPLLYPADKDFVLVELTKGKVAKINVADVPRVGDYNWHTNSKGYAVTNTYDLNGNRTKEQMHRLINNTPDELDTDHINGDPLDNRKENLRSVTKSQNHQNRRKRQKLSSNYKGVHWDKHHKSWRAQIHFDGNQRIIGRFKSEIEAAEEYDREAINEFGKYACLNFTNKLLEATNDQNRSITRS